MLDLSQQAANEIYGWANVALIAGATLVLGGTIAVIWTAGIRERFADQRISKNEAETAAANSQAETAKAAAAQAKNATESERLARMELEAKVAPRRLDDAQLRLISGALATFAGRKVVISSYAFDTDGIVLAEQIQMAVLAAKIFVINEIGAHIPAHAPIIEGIRVSGSNKPLIAEIKKSLHASGLVMDDGTKAIGGELLEFKEPADVVATIYVGAKPITTKL